MVNVQRVLEALVSRLPVRLQPIAKAVTPVVVGVVVILANALITGELDVVALKAAGGAVVLAALVFLVPNLEGYKPY